MIISFYDREFNPLFNNASLLIDNESFELVKRPIELNDFSCVCEPFTEDIQPTFLVVKNDRGNSKNLVYSALAGVPILTAENKTEINATDLKTIFSSDVVIEYGVYANISQVINKIFTEWNTQVNRNSISCRIEFVDNAGAVEITDFKPSTEKQVYNALDEISSYLEYYKLYIDSRIDIIEKEVVFTIGKLMTEEMNIKLWEYGERNFGKWVADVNEVQGYYINENNVWSSLKDTDGNDIVWILTKDNDITIDTSKRDIYPIKKRIFTSTESVEQANKDALNELLNARYNEDIEIPTNDENIGLSTNFNIYLRRGEEKYKSLPCGELRYNANGLYEVQIGFRYTGVNFI